MTRQLAHQPITRAALAAPGDRLTANGFCTVCGILMAAISSPERVVAHLRNHVSHGEAIELPDRGGLLTAFGASEARKRAEYERIRQSP